MQHAALAFELKGAPGAGEFTGLASVYGNRDLGGDVVERGAFTKTLRERGASVPILWQHDQKNPIGLGTLTDSFEGLVINGKLDLDTEDGRRAYSGMKAGYLKGLSIGYDVVKQKYIGDARYLTELKLYEVSTVTFPMNEAAQVASVKRRLEGKEGRRFSAATRGKMADAIAHIEQGHAASATSRRSHRKALAVLEGLLDEGDDSNGVASDDEKEVVRLLSDHVQKMRELLATPPASSLDDICRRMSDLYRRIGAASPS